MRVIPEETYRPGLVLQEFWVGLSDAPPAGTLNRTEDEASWTRHPVTKCSRVWLRALMPSASHWLCWAISVLCCCGQLTRRVLHCLRKSNSYCSRVEGSGVFLGPSRTQRRHRYWHQAQRGAKNSPCTWLLRLEM